VPEQTQIHTSNHWNRDASLTSNLWLILNPVADWSTELASICRRIHGDDSRRWTRLASIFCHSHCQREKTRCMTGSCDGSRCIKLSLTNQKPCLIAVDLSTNCNDVYVAQMNMKERCISYLQSWCRFQAMNYCAVFFHLCYPWCRDKLCHRKELRTERGTWFVEIL